MSVRRAPKDQEGSLIQRCVIVQKDENGYGLTVSGDNPVYVQSVRENGSAAKAGVQVGDRIIKVNGILVTKSNHIEVVKLIKSGSYVALTLLGRPPGERISSGSPSPISERAFSYNRSLNQSISPTQKELPDSQQQERLVALQRMLDQEHLYYNKTIDGYKLSPSSKLQKDLADSQTRIKAIENQIRIISSNHTANKIQLVSQSSRSVFKPIVDNRPASPKVTGHIRSKSAYSIRSQSSSSIPHAASFSADYPSSEFDAFARSVSLDYTAEEEESGEERSKEQGGSLEDGSRGSEDRRGDISSPDCRQAVDETEQGITMSASARSLAQHVVESMHGNPPDGDESPPIIEVHDQAMESEPLPKKREFDETDASPTTTSPTKLPQMNIFPAEDINQNQDGIFQGGKIEHLQPLHPATSVISMEDEEFELDNEKIDDHGPFVDLNCLKNKPAHLAIFLHFLMSNSDPSALFFWLVTEIYAAEQGSVKDFKKWAYEIYSVFLSINAPLKVSISENADQAIDEALSNKNSTEEGLRNIFKTARLFAFNEVSEQLADFRNKRALGLGSLFGDNQLEDDLDKSKELKVVEDTLLPHIEALVFETESGNNGSAQQDRNSAMASSLATFMKHVRNNVKPGSSQASPLDKCRSFVEKERSSLFKFRPSKKIFNIKGHQFVPMQYTSITQCHYCGETLWGIGHQGFQCSACEYNVHKGTCSDSVDEVCPGSKRKYKERNKARRIPPKDFKQRLPVKDYSTDEVIIDSRSDSQSLPVETRSRDNSINEDILKSSSVSGKDSVLSGEESTLSETETERSESRHISTSVNEEVPTQPLPQSTSLRFRPPDNWRRKELYGGVVDRSISLRSPRELVKIQEKKRSIPPLPGLPAKGGLTGDNGVYSAYPFPGPKGGVESPPVSEDEEEWDPDLDVEEETPIWSQVVDKKTVKGLKNKELKRQEVIHELIHTEKTHVRKLLVLEKVFYKPMMRKNVLPPESLHQLFPNLEDLISVHTSLLAAMKARSAENEVVQVIGDIMLARFDSAAGDVVKEAAATFCNYQKIALEALKNRQKKDPKVNSFMVQQELNPLCRRLKFPDIIASTHQRFTKYPLLLEGIAKATLQNHSDRKDVEKCVECCKAILNHINQTIKDTENTARLIELSKKIEVKQIESSNQNMKKEIAELDITSHKLIYEGDLIWRITRNKSIELHALLLNDVLVLLQKQDEKYILKCHSTTGAGGNLEAKKITHSPVIKLSNLLARNVATDKKAFFIVSTSSLGPQIYEMVTASTTERRTWFKVISDSVELAKGKVLERGRRGGLSLGSTPTIPEANGKEEGREKEKSTEKDSDEEEDEENNQSDTSLTKSDSNKIKSPVDFEKLTNEAIVDDNCEPGGEGRFHSEDSSITASYRAKRKTEPPSKERMAYLYEQLKQKDEELKRVIEEKEKIVAELRGEDPPPFIAQEQVQDCELEPKELVLAAILQANRLTLAVNDMCNLHRSLMADQSESRDGSFSTSPPPVSHLEDRDNEEELHRQDILLEVTATLNEQLTTILGLVAERDNTRERLHSELQSAKATIQRISHAGLVHSISQPNDDDDLTHSVSDAPSDYCELYSPEFKKQVSLPSAETGDSLFGPRRGSSPHFLPEDSTVVSGLNTDANQEESILLVDHLDDTLESYDV